MNIRRSDLVLEIGSGNDPHPRADVLCDRYVESDAERGGSIVIDRPLVEADAQCLPFRDGAFDYVICAQVLEHVEDPERMLHELMRVASRGYIETPSEIAERLYGWPFHRSVINLVEGRLMIRRKRFQPQFGQLFHVLAARDPAYRGFHLTHNHLFMVRYEWEGRIDFEIESEDSTPLDLGSREFVETLCGAGGGGWRSTWLPRWRDLAPRPLAAWGKSILARSRRRVRPRLQDLIVCPACRGPIAWGSEEISCERCAAVYPVRGGIPRLVPPGPPEGGPRAGGPR